MARTTTFTRLAAAALALAAAAGLGLSGTGEAAASREFPVSTCIGPSPNVIDLPFMVRRAIVDTYAGNAYIAADFPSYFPGGYQSSLRMDWHNQSTGKRGSKLSNTRVRPPYQGVHYFVIPVSQIGRGRVDVTFSAVNSNALWSVPSTSCRGTIVVP
ncbi:MULTISPECIES: hypothetical protein [Gordonia]|uniref:hypothetical protein n=1 Tax=Gordonia TaxID=2053 RepID=UPI000BB7E1BC|nr:MULTISPECIES: hypothetical protein [Gordonia]ATD69560.1 hypothetical protein CNO18_03800 [Gordonia sp. 1D]MDJ0453283.1 hypothetical protein [Gordonia amicalis]MDV7076301.1 hypothetical protein [Gordonia amicalis]UKO93085.1 hypothetical protein IHQ52_06885 [Gordonia amicalis]